MNSHYGEVECAKKERERTEIYSLETQRKTIVFEVKPYRHVTVVTLGTRHTPRTLQDEENTVIHPKNGVKEHPTHKTLH